MTPQQTIRALAAHVKAAVVPHLGTWRARKVTGIAREAWRFLYRSTFEERHWNVLEQDRTMLEQCDPDANKHENLYAHDMGLVRLRRILRNQATQQIAALSEAGRRVA